jgi:hypothetical protein
MASNQDKKHWVFRVGVADRAGALTSIASAFSNRGFSIETVVGHGTVFPGGRGGAVVVTFWCTEEEKDYIVRIVRRLSKATYLEEHPYESDKLRKSALVRVSRKLLPADIAGRDAFLLHEFLREEKGVCTYFLASSPSEIDAVLSRLSEQQILKDVVYSVIGP